MKFISVPAILVSAMALHEVIALLNSKNKLHLVTILLSSVIAPQAIAYASNIDFPYMESCKYDNGQNNAYRAVVIFLNVSILFSGILALR
jgi:hypothetical protein